MKLLIVHLKIWRCEFMKRNFWEMVQKRKTTGLCVSVGLDPDVKRIGEGKGLEDVLYWFCKEIVDLTKDLACVYKPNIAFFERYPRLGPSCLFNLIKYIQQNTDVPVILDAKRGDTPDTNMLYAKELFDEYQADAVTVSPYCGGESLKPFLKREDKGIIVLCKTSNPGSGEFQDLMVESNLGTIPFYRYVAYKVNCSWNINRNCGLVVGATYPEELKIVRDTVGDYLPILIPGVGAQGGDLEKTIKYGRNNIIINSSRGIIFAPNPEKALFDLNNQINLLMR